MRPKRAELIGGLIRRAKAPNNKKGEKEMVTATAVSEVRLRPLTSFIAEGGGGRISEYKGMGPLLDRIQRSETVLGTATKGLHNMPVVNTYMTEFKIVPVQDPFIGAFIGLGLHGYDISTESWAVPGKLEYGIARNKAADSLLKWIRGINPGLFVRASFSHDEIPAAIAQSFQSPNIDTFIRVISPFDMAAQMFGQTVKSEQPLGTADSRHRQYIKVAATRLESHETFGIFREEALDGYLMGFWLQGYDISPAGRSDLVPVELEYSIARMKAESEIMRQMQNKFPWFSVENVTDRVLDREFVDPNLPRLEMGRFNMAVLLRPNE